MPRLVPQRYRAQDTIRHHRAGCAANVAVSIRPTAVMQRPCSGMLPHSFEGAVNLAAQPSRPSSCSRLVRRYHRSVARVQGQPSLLWLNHVPAGATCRMVSGHERERVPERRSRARSWARGMPGPSCQPNSFTHHVWTWRSRWPGAPGRGLGRAGCAAVCAPPRPHLSRPHGRMPGVAAIVPAVPGVRWLVAWPARLSSPTCGRGHMGRELGGPARAGGDNVDAAAPGSEGPACDGRGGCG